MLIHQVKNQEGGKLSPLVSFSVCIFKKWSKKIRCISQQNAENKLVCKMNIRKQYMFIIEKEKFKKGTSLKQDSFLFSFLLFPNMVKLQQLQI